MRSRGRGLGHEVPPFCPAWSMFHLVLSLLVHSRRMILAIGQPSFFKVATGLWLRVRGRPAESGIVCGRKRRPR